MNKVTVEGYKPHTTNILWISRHSVTKEQYDELELAFGKINIIPRNITISHPRKIKELMAECNCQEVVAVLPLSMIAQLPSTGITPIRAVMTRKMNSKGEVVYNHDHFEVVEEVIVKAHPLLRGTLYEVENDR